MTMKHVIHIYGASGSGTSTLGRKICDELGWRFMDADDYYWLPTNPRYTAKRDKSERLALMKQDIQAADHAVLAGSLVGWGDELIPLFCLAIRVVTATDIRIARIREREYKKFGSRIEPGGDMYLQHMDFLAWAAGYDNGDMATRSRRLHDEWQKLLPCPCITVNGAQEINDMYKEVSPWLYTEI